MKMSTQKELLELENLQWRNKRCPSCKLGFNAKSKPKCFGCDSFSHSKPSCFNKGVETPHFYCKVCAPVSETLPTSKDKVKIAKKCATLKV